MNILVLLLLTVIWAQQSISVDVDFGEGVLPRMRHRQIRGLTLEEQRQLVGTFSTRPNFDKTEIRNNIDIWNCITSESLSAYDTAFNDPFWKFQWYQKDCRVSIGPVWDHNIVPVQRMGFNGKSIKVGILGERLVQDLFDMQDRVKEIYNAMKTSSVSVNKKALPSIANMASKMAGVIGMNANNSLCGAGIAFNSEVTGITVMDDDRYNKKAIINGINHKLLSLHILVDAIKKKHDGIEMLFSRGIINGLADFANQGREKKGGIYVVGAGDGGENNDNCGADYIVNSIHTFVIGSAWHDGLHATYSEKCSAILATAYSTKELDVAKYDHPVGVVTINGRDSCSNSFGGTAASAAIASGIFALTLQANPNLSWRDLMHIIAMSSEKAPLYRSTGWKLNSAGFYVSHMFGFGLLNAENMVLTSQNWEPVPKMITCKLKFQTFDNIQHGGISRSTLEVENCPSMQNEKESLNYIEQVELVTTIWYLKRGSIWILLTSPKGTDSNLLFKREKDLSLQGFNKWHMRSLHFWGEHPFGMWELNISAHHRIGSSEHVVTNLIISLSRNLMKVGSLGFLQGNIRSAELLIHGTSAMPKHYNQRRTYSYSPHPETAIWL